MTDQSSNLALTPEFNVAFGLFYTAWATTEAAMDCAIGKLLRLEPSETHLLTAGMEHGRKATLLRGLISRGDHHNKEKLIRSLNVIQNESLRNVFAHSYIASDEKTITFIERSRGGPFKTKEHHFTLEEFRDHVTNFLEASSEFEQALDLAPLELQAFQYAALSVKSKP
jgi:hypothetical protein